MRQVKRPDRSTLPQGGQVLNKGVVAASVAPALDPADVGAEFAHTRRVIGPDIAVTSNPVSAGISFRGADIESRRAVNGFLKCGGDSSKFRDVIAPFRANDGSAMARGDAMQEVFNERGVAGGVRGERQSAADDPIGVGGVVGVLLLLWTG